MLAHDAHLAPPVTGVLTCHTGPVTATAAEARTWRPPPQEPMVLIVVSVAFLAAAFLANLVVMAGQVGGTPFPADAQVRPDGVPHTVPVAEGRDAMLWTQGDYPDVTCSFADPGTGSSIPTVSTDRSYRRTDEVVEWVGVATLDPVSDAVTRDLPRARRGHGVRGAGAAAPGRPHRGRGPDAVPRPPRPRRRRRDRRGAGADPPTPAPCGHVLTAIVASVGS